MKSLLPACGVSLSLVLGCGDSGSDGGAGGQSATTSSPQTSASGNGSGATKSATGASGSGQTSTTAAATGSQASSATGAGSGFAQLSLDLCDVINEYRATQGLAAVPISVSLMTVAEAHVADLDAHPDVLEGECNLHSWSETSAEFGGCCYTPDHAQAQCMWDKPRELTDYTGNGYEIAASGTPTPEGALSAWQGSPGHHDVILNAGQWGSFSPWPAMGCGILGAYAVVWFGDAPDPDTL